MAEPAGEVEFLFSKKEIHIFMEEFSMEEMEEMEEMEATELFNLDNGDIVSRTPSSQRSVALLHSKRLLKDLPSFINHHGADDVKQFLSEFISARAIKVVIQNLKELDGKKMSNLDMKECVLVFGSVTLELLKSIGMKSKRIRMKSKRLSKAEENFKHAKASTNASKELIGKSSSKKSRLVETKEAKENALGKADKVFHKAIINLLVLLHRSNYDV